MCKQIWPRRAILSAVRALMNFMHREGWHFHILAEETRTVLVSDRRIGQKEALLSIIARLHGDVAEARHVIKRENKGSVWIEISQAQIAALRDYKRRHSTVDHNGTSSC
jgi:hypothetical protein